MAYKAILLEDIGNEIPEVAEIRHKHVSVESTERLFELLHVYCTNRKLELVQIQYVYGAQTFLVVKEVKQTTE